MFQKLGNQACQEDNYSYILQSNALTVLGQEAGGTCIIGTDHDNAMNRYKWEGLTPDDNIEYKMIEAKGERIITADLDIGKRVYKSRQPQEHISKMKNASIIQLNE